MTNKLTIKDLVLIGVFFIIYFFIITIVGVVGVVPILFLLYPILAAIICGVVVILFMAKVPKKWALFILGLLLGFVMSNFGQIWIILLMTAVIALVAELVFRKGKYSSFKYNAIAYAIFACWPISTLMQALVMREQFIEGVKEMNLAPDYITNIETLLSYQTILLLFMFTFLAGLLGAYIGGKILKKHFKKAGIV